MTSLFDSGVVHSRLFRAPAWTRPLDSVCGAPGCFVIWNDDDWARYSGEFEPIPSRLLGQATLRSGDASGVLVELAPVARNARLVPSGAHLLLVESVPGERLQLRRLDWSGAEAGPPLVVATGEVFSFAVTRYGDGALVVWTAGGELLGRLVTSDLGAGPAFHIAAGIMNDRRVFVAATGSRATVLYDRVSAEASWVPRSFHRELTAEPARRHPVRRASRPDSGPHPTVM